MEFVTKQYKISKGSSSEVKIPDSLLELILKVVKTYNVKEEDISFYRKGYETYKTPDFVPGERAIITYITTGRKDRDNDIVLPGGIILDEYLKHPVVIPFHRYDRVPVGKNMWIKADAANYGLVAKTLYAKHDEADKIYNYRKDGFPLATSIGFVPLEYKRKGESGFDIELKAVLKNGWVTEKEANDVQNIITKSVLIEYSDVSIPSNPDALQLAVNKGFGTEQDIVTEAANARFLIHVDGLKEDPSIEIKTTTPPIELTEVKKEVEKIEEKMLDKKGNPSVSDIRSAIYGSMPMLKEMLYDAKYSIKDVNASNTMNDMYLNIEDLYPIDYPNGHFICGCCMMSEPCTICYHDVQYTYDAQNKTVEFKKQVEVEPTYVPKDFNCEKDLVDKQRLARFIKNSTIDSAEIENLEEVSININTPLLEDKKKNSIVIVKTKDKLFWSSGNLIKELTLADDYRKNKVEQAKKDFSNLISNKGLSSEEWNVLYTKYVELFISTPPGADEIVKFCEGEGILHKNYSQISSIEDEISKGVDETENEIRIRIKDPSSFQQDSFRTKTIKADKPSVRGIFGKLIGETSMTLQSLRFPKGDGWTKEKALKWAKAHNFKDFIYSDELSKEEVIELIGTALTASSKTAAQEFEDKISKMLGRVVV